jgi:hypothetical protein
MRKTHPATKLLERIAIDPIALSQIYVKRKTVLGFSVNIKNFWWFPLEFERVCFEPAFSGRSSFGQVMANVSPSKLRRAQKGQIQIPDCKFSDDEVLHITVSCQNAGWADLNFSGSLKFHTWFGSFEHKISLGVRCDTQTG